MKTFDGLSWNFFYEFINCPFVSHFRESAANLNFKLEVFISYKTMRRLTSNFNLGMFIDEQLTEAAFLASLVELVGKWIAEPFGELWTVCVALLDKKSRIS
jgi:hypothetical protein